MRWLKRLFEFYIHSSIHVSLAVISLVVITTIEFQLELTFDLFGFILFGSIIGYTFVKLTANSELAYGSVVKHVDYMLLFLIICLGFFLYFLVKLSMTTILVVSVFGIITMLYSIPMLSKSNLRNFGGLKIFLVAFVWAGVTVIIPLVDANQGLVVDHWLSFIQRFIWVVVITLPFEIRDLEFDSKSLHTIPQKFGLKKTKQLGGVFLILTVLLEFFKSTDAIYFVLSYLFASVIVFFAVFLAKEKQPAYYASFWVESIPIIWLGMLLLLRQFLF